MPGIERVTFTDNPLSATVESLFEGVETFSCGRDERGVWRCLDTGLRIDQDDQALIEEENEVRLFLASRPPPDPQ